MLRFSIDLPPLRLSECFSNARRAGRVDSPQYKAWKRMADMMVMAALVGRARAGGSPLVPGRVGVRFVVRDKNDRSDLDNKLKCLCDMLVRNFIITDDSYIDRLEIVRTKAEAPEVAVEVWPN